MSVVSAGVPASGGLMYALRAIGGTLNEVVRVRGALFAVELREEVERRKHMLLLAAFATAFLHTALLLLTLFIAVVFWDTYRVAAIGAMTIVYLLCGTVALMRLRVAIAESPGPFAASLGELKRDLAEMRSTS